MHNLTEQHKAVSTGSIPVQHPPLPSSFNHEESISKHIAYLRTIQPFCRQLFYHEQIQKLMDTGYFSHEEAVERLRKQASAAGFASPTSATAAAVTGGTSTVAANKKDGPITTINPYAAVPRLGVEVVDVGVQPVLEDITRIKVRFDENYIFCVEDIQLEMEDNLRSSYLGWSIKRVKQNELDSLEYRDEKDGKMKKRFNFSGRFATLPELHRAVKNIGDSSFMNPMITKEQAQQLDPNAYGMVDISAASRPEYTNQIFGFSNFRVYVEDTTYVNQSLHLVTYKALTITKRKSEKSKTKSKNEKDFFVLHIPARRIPHLVLAIELAMEINNVKPLPALNTEDTCSLVEEQQEVSPAKLRIKFKKSRPVISSDSDSDVQQETSANTVEQNASADDDEGFLDDVDIDVMMQDTSATVAADNAAADIQTSLEDKLAKRMRKKQREKHSKKSKDILRATRKK